MASQSVKALGSLMESAGCTLRARHVRGVFTVKIYRSNASDAASAPGEDADLDTAIGIAVENAYEDFNLRE
jgi:hypothetical protein